MRIPIQHPRLTSSLREPFDADDAFLRRKSIIKQLLKRSSSNSISDSELPRKIINRWDEASPEVRLAYKQFVASVVELINGEIPSEVFREVAYYAYGLFGGSDALEGATIAEFSRKRSELQALIGQAVSENAVRNVASQAHKLYNMQPEDEMSSLNTEGDEISSSSDEFGSDFSFQEPARFLVDLSNLCECVHDRSKEHVHENGKASLYNSSHGANTRIDRAPARTVVKSDVYDLIWIRNACEIIVREGATQLSRDDLAMAICRVLDSDKPGEEVAGDLFDLLGDGAFSVVQDLLGHRKEIVDSFCNAWSIVKSANNFSNGQPRVPSYGTQVTVHLESDKIMDKLRRKEEKRQKRGIELGYEAEPSDISFYSLIGALEKKLSIEGHIGYGAGSHLMPGTALPHGTTRKHFKGYEEVIVPPTPTAQMKPGERLIDINELDNFAQTAFSGYKSLNRIQSQIFEAVYQSNENILVCAPTGAGKTNIAMIAILHEIGQHFKDGYLHKNEFKIVYVAPMKALAAEVTATFSHRLSPLNMNVRELTGDMQLSKNELEETQMIVTTPEKWDVITRKSSDMSLSMLVKLLIIDEVHLLNEDRGPVIEALVARTLRQVESTQTMIRIVGLSATLPNYIEVAQFLRVNSETGLFFFDSSYRPVPLSQQYIGISEQNFLARMELLNEICYKKVVDSVRQGHQAMVFVHSRKDTAKTASKLVELARKFDDLSIFDSSDHPQHSLLKKEVVKSRNKDLVELFEYGVGIHHAGMLRADRSLTERLFSAGVLKTLVCTATLAWGVNLPAHTVVIKGTQLYDSKAGGWRDLGMLDVMQIFGRAGRPQFDKSGEGIIITSHDKLAYYLRLLTSQLPIESQFITSLKDNLNAEVALGTVTNVKEACAWLGYTYLFIRMRQNPLAYGISWEEVIADPSLVLKQRNLVIDAARALDIAKMMRFDEKSGNFYCTELGRIASHFYIQYSSVETYNDMLRRHMSDSEIIDMVAHSSEFENIPIREEEQNELENLLRTSCPLEPKGGASNKHGKISILIQLYISRGFINTFSLVSDAAYISASLARIMRALFEICLRRGWAEMSLLLLEYCKAVDRQIWPHQHPLRQFDKELSLEILSKLEDRRADLDRLEEMEEKDIGALIRYPHGGKLVKQHLGYFPWLQLSATVCPITRTVLKVDLLITADFTWKERFHGAALRWWILVEDSENDHIYHSELFTLTRKMATGEPQKLSFNVPIFEPHPTQYYIHAVSDSWLQAEALFTISFHNLALPEGRTTHTELLDLKPLPVSSLCNKAYEALYKFSHFNPIQTQIFHVLYNTDNNVLLGAPTGSGKTISAELAMLRLFNLQADMKVVYIAPLKAIVRERMKDWEKHLVSQLGKRMVEMTGDYTPDLKALLAADVIVSTPEKWDGISRNWHSRSYVKKVGLMILDEIHLLGADRGPILEVIVSRMRYITSQTKRSVRFVGLSTALANASDLADWLGVDEIGLFNFKPSVRPVPLEVHIQGYPGKYYCPRMNSMNKPAYAAINTHSPTKPVIIFVSSRRQTRLTALDLIQFAASDEHPVQFLSISEENLQMVLSQVTDQNLRHTLQFGIGLHHAGLNDKDRGLVEELFSHNKIQILVCTSTLAWGVNLPAHLVIIKGTEYYDGKSKRYVDFPITDILQMMGRAGRPQYDQHGKAVILVHEPKKSFYKKFLYEPFPVESSLKDQVHDHFNAEIVAGTICDKNDALHYLSWTYFFRRLMVNPSYYGLENAESETLNSYLSRLVQWTFEDLEDCRCVKITDNRVEPTILGILASQYYLSYVTVAMFGSSIGPETSLNVLLRILSDAAEYNELPVRHNEENYNEALSAKVRYPVDKNRYDNPHTKANLLFQAHFSQLELPISDYITDLKSVLDQSIRIIQAMIDVAANSGWLSASITCMHIMQMIIQGLWFDKDSALWMIPCMNSDLEGLLSKRGISTVQQVLDLPRAELLAIVGKDHSAKLFQELQLFPRIQMTLKLGQKIVNDKQIGVVNIKLKKMNSKHNTPRAFAPRFPKVKDEAWWLVLGNSLTSELHALRRISFIDELSTHMELPPIAEGTKVFLISDTYLGMEYECPLDRLTE